VFRDGALWQLPPELSSERPAIVAATQNYEIVPSNNGYTRTLISNNNDIVVSGRFVNVVSDSYGDFAYVLLDSGTGDQNVLAYDITAQTPEPSSWVLCYLRVRWEFAVY